LTDYISISLETDPQAIKDSELALLEERIPGLVVQDGHPINVIVEADAEQHAITRELATEVFDTIWESFGANLRGKPINAATQATGLTTWTRTSSVGDQLLPAGTTMTVLGADGTTRVGFQTTQDVTILSGQLSTGIGEVEILAVEAGSTGSGLQTDPQLEDALAWVDTITVEAPTTGGADEEDRDAYRNRLVTSTRLTAETLVLAQDFADDAVANVALIARALPLDGYNPGDGTSNNAGIMTLAVVNSAGLDPGGTARSNGQAFQAAKAVSHLTINWIAATYTTIAVVFAAKCYAQYDPADVEARAEAAVLAFLSPANWGRPPFGDSQAWLDRPIVRYRDVVAAIENVEGLDYTTSVTVNAGTADVTMTGPAALPGSASTAAGTVTSP
jgi:hypothetical protein